ncbi:MAG: DUF1579 domain-containing protein [Gemmatimonadota bacterium]|nr:DUF1579 domain-containing protein [Gemmatimonadota bacterium]
MKYLRSAGAFALVATLAPAVLVAQEPDQPSPEMAAMMEAYAEAAKPGPEHALMASMAGSYTVTSKFWMDPSAPPSETTYGYRAHMVMDGRYLVEEYDGEMMGQPFKGMGLMAYDNSEQRFVSAWIDNMGTGIMTMHGEANEDHSEISWWGEVKDPVRGQMQKIKSVTRITSPTERTYEMFMVLPDGSLFKNMEITHTKKKEKKY